jgi:hypothetical protein
MNETHNMSWVWLLLFIATTFSFASIFLFFKLLKKLDDNMISASEAIMSLNEKLSSLIKEVEFLKRSHRIINNEVKEKRSIDKTKNQRII